MMTTEGRWVYRPRPLARPDVRLVCLPYAGAMAQVFGRWADTLPPGVELCAVQLPGRANRWAEEPYRDIGRLMPALAEGLRPWMDAPFVLLGHSMGAIVAFELTRHLRRHHRRAPDRLVVSGCRAPQVALRTRRLHNLPDAELLQELRTLGGTPAAILDQPTALRLFTGLLRADLALFETYSHVPEAPLECPILVLGGLNDPRVPVEDLAGWRAHSTRCEIRHLPGDHFFLHAFERHYLRELAAVLPAAPPLRGRTPSWQGVAR